MAQIGEGGLDIDSGRTLVEATREIEESLVRAASELGILERVPVGVQQFE